MKFFRTSLVFFLSTCILSTVASQVANARPWNFHHKQLLGEKTMESNPATESKTFSFSQTGGFAFTNKKFETNFADLKEGERAELQKLIDQSGLATAKSATKTTPGAADMFFYDFKYSVGRDEHHVSYDDGSLPQAYRPLIKYCTPKMVDKGTR